MKKGIKILGVICLFAGPIVYIMAVLADMTIGDKDGIVFYRKLWQVLGIAQFIGLYIGSFLLLNGLGRKRMLQSTLGLLVAIGISEITLRFNNKLYNAISEDDHFILNDTVQIHNNPAVHDSIVIQKYNRIGFKGPNLFDLPANYSKLFFIGNSVSACGYLNTGEDWPLLIFNSALEDTSQKIWMNNAAMVGHSSHGNLALLKKYLVNYKPKFVVIMAGFTEQENGEPNYFDEKTFSSLRKSEALEGISKYSYLVKLYQYLKFRSKSETFLSNTDYIDFENAKHADNTEKRLKSLENQKSKIKFSSFANNLDEILKVCATNNIQAVLMTHPTMVGKWFDDVTGANLETILIYNRNTGKEMQTILEEYNDITRDKAAEFNVPLIDLYHKVPRSSKYYFDHEHFTKEGCHLVADTVWKYLKPIINGVK